MAENFLQKLKSRVNKRDLLLRAIEGNSKEKFLVFDMSFGLGNDSILLALRGHEVRAWERNQEVFEAGSILLDSLSDENLAITLNFGEAIAGITEVLKLHESLKNCVFYFDPMFSQKAKSLPKKDLVKLRETVGDDLDADKVFALARKIAPKLVVKRQDKAPFLDNKKPDYSLKGKTVRYDVYLKL